MLWTIPLKFCYNVLAMSDFIRFSSTLQKIPVVFKVLN